MTYGWLCDNFMAIHTLPRYCQIQTSNLQMKIPKGTSFGETTIPIPQNIKLWWEKRDTYPFWQPSTVTGTATAVTTIYLCSKHFLLLSKPPFSKFSNEGNFIHRRLTVFYKLFWSYYSPCDSSLFPLITVQFFNLNTNVTANFSQS